MVEYIETSGSGLPEDLDIHGSFEYRGDDVTISCSNLRAAVEWFEADTNSKDKAIWDTTNGLGKLLIFQEKTK